jgi:hypothetical protein
MWCASILGDIPEERRKDIYRILLGQYVGSDSDAIAFDNSEATATNESCAIAANETNATARNGEDVTTGGAPPCPPRARTVALRD